jgi:DNA polymerase-3 subunit alpha
VVEAIISERETGGAFADVWDFMERMAGSVNRKSLETLVHAGAFDSMGYKRSQFFCPCADGNPFIDNLVHYAELYRDDTLDSASSLFGDMEELKPKRPDMPPFVGEEDQLKLLQSEKEFVGMYLSAHPLDRYAFEIENFTTCKLADLSAKIDECDRAKSPCKAAIAGIITDIKTLITRSSKPGARITLEDYSGNYEIALFGKDYEAYMPYMQLHAQLFIEGEINERYFVRQEDRGKGKTVPYAFKISKISLLGNISDSYVKALALNLDSESLNKEFRAALIKLLKANSGNVKLMVNLFERARGYRIEMNSKKYRVAVCQDLLYGLDKLGISYSVVK